MVSGMSNQARRTAPGLIEIVQKASQSLPPAGGKSNAIRFFAAACTSQKTLQNTMNSYTSSGVPRKIQI